MFSPKHPVTRPDKEEMKVHFDSLKMEALIDEAVENTVVYTFSDQGDEIECREVRRTEYGED